MAMVSVRVEARGLSDVKIFLDGVKRRMVNLSPAMKKAAVLMLGSVDKNFKSGGRPAPWRPLAFSTLREKRRKGYSPLPLTRTGQMKRSIAEGFPSQNSFSIGTAVKYARIHQYGGRAGRGHRANIPARPFLVFQGQDLSRIEGLILEHINADR